MHLELSPDLGSTWVAAACDANGKLQTAGGGGGLSVTTGAAIGTAATPVAGKDGAGNAQFFNVDTSGNQTNVGNVAHGTADSGSPIKVGGKANSTFPAAVTAGQRVDAWLGLYGAVMVSPVSPTGSADNSGSAFWAMHPSGVAGTLAVTPTLMNAAGLLDRQRNNLDATLLASAARTATTASPDQVNYNGRGVHVTLNVTVASGTGGLTVQVQGKDPVSGTYYQLNANPTAVIATGITVYELYPGTGTASGGVTQRSSGILPRTWRVNVSAGDGSSYTYSVGAAVIL